MSTEDEIRKASAQFYAALNRMLNGDAQPLFDIWSHSPAVTTMHPIGGRQVGWNEVRESWEQVAQGASDGKVELKDQLIRVLGDVAYEVGLSVQNSSSAERRSPARFGRRTFITEKLPRGR
jgi:ketosteroid isomerase-like protein